MSFDWKEYLIVATELLTGSDERVGVHQKVIEHYKNSSDQTEQRIGLNLASLKRYRIKCDYEDGHSIDQALANRMVAIAYNAIQQL